jgi:hypothetical protein
MTAVRFAAASLAVGAMAQAVPTMAQGVTAESLRGKSIQATVQYQQQIRREGREFAVSVTAEWRLNIGSDDRVTGSISRTSTSPRGPVSTSRPISAVIGKPNQIRDAGGGHGLILLSGNTLTLLRTFEVGGVKNTITFTGGGGCTINAPIMREVGAGPTRRDAIVGGTVEIISAKQVSSSCRVQ